MSGWVPDVLSPEVYQDGEKSTPKRAAFDFRGFTVTDDAANGRKIITPADIKGSVHAATTAALPTNTRTGNTLQANANGALAAQDTIPPFVGMRVLVKDEASQLKNGIYKITQVGSASLPWIMVREPDADDSFDFTPTSQWLVRAGAANGGKRFTSLVSGTFVLNTDAIVFTNFTTTGVIDVKASFGAIGNGSTNDTTAIANAIAACIAAGGGIVYFPPGTYLTDAITVTNGTGVRLVGAGQATSIIKARQTGNIITLTGCNGCGVELLAIERRDALFQTAAGSSLFITNCNHCYTRELRISYCQLGITVEKSTNTHLKGQTRVDHVRGGGGAGAVRFVGQTGGGFAIGLHIDWLKYDHTYNNGTHVVRGSRSNVTGYNVGDIIFHNDRYWECTTAGTSALSAPGGLSAVPGTDGSNAYSTGVTDGGVTWKFLIGNAFILQHDFNAFTLEVQRLDCSGPATHGFTMWRSDGTANAPSNCQIFGGRIEQTIGIGINLDRGSDVYLHPDVDRSWGDNGITVNTNFGGKVEIEAGWVENCFGKGINVASSDVSIRGVQVRDCSQAGSGSHAGIALQAVSNTRVIGCRSSGSLQSYGVDINAAATNLIVVSNDCLGNVSGGVNNPGGTSATRVVANNI